MKRISFVLILSFLCSLGAHANNLRTIRASIDSIDSLVNTNARRINRRQAIASDINNILQEAQVLIEQSLARNNQGPIEQVDIQLVNVALQACSNLNTYSGRANCFKGYLTNIGGILLDLKSGCEKASSSENKSNCYTYGLKAIKANKLEINEVALASCSNLNTYSDRKACYAGLVNESNEIGIIVLKDACKSASSSENISNCFKAGLNVANVVENPIGAILSGCKDLNTYSDRSSCFKGGVNSTESLGLNIKRYVNGCYNTSSSEQASNCFRNGLNAL